MLAIFQTFQIAPAAISRTAAGILVRGLVISFANLLPQLISRAPATISGNFGPGDNLRDATLGARNFSSYRQVLASGLHSGRRFGALLEPAFAF